MNLVSRQRRKYRNVVIWMLWISAARAFLPASTKHSIPTIPSQSAFPTLSSLSSFSTTRTTTPFQRIQRQHSIRLMAVAKSGGKMIETEEMYQQLVLAEKSNKPVLVFFSAPWCGPCRLTNPVVKDVMKEYAGDIDVVEVCTDDLAEIAEEAGVVSIPTIQFYYQGQALETIVGCVAKSVLANAVDKVLEDIEQLQKST